MNCTWSKIWIARAQSINPTHQWLCCCVGHISLRLKSGPFNVYLLLLYLLMLIQVFLSGPDLFQIKFLTIIWQSRIPFYSNFEKNSLIPLQKLRHRQQELTKVKHVVIFSPRWFWRKLLKWRISGSPLRPVKLKYYCSINSFKGSRFETVIVGFSRSRYCTLLFPITNHYISERDICMDHIYSWSCLCFTSKFTTSFHASMHVGFESSCISAKFHISD